MSERNAQTPDAVETPTAAHSVGEPAPTADKSDAHDKLVNSIKDRIENKRNKDLAEMIASVESEKTRHYILTRVIPQMDWYSQKSRENKKLYTRLMLVSIFFGAAIPVLSVLLTADAWITILIAALGAGVTAINAVLNLYNFKDLWTTYRDTRETLLKTLHFYFNNANGFAKQQPAEERDALLIKQCEDAFARERGDWNSMVKE